MRTINLIVVHCSATREDKSFTEHDLDVCHRRRGFNGVGYHFYIRKNGDIKSTRPLERIGAHSRGFNREGIGIVSADNVILVPILTETARLSRKSGSRLAPVLMLKWIGIKNKSLFSFTYSIISCYWLIVIGY